MDRMKVVFSRRAWKRDGAWASMSQIRVKKGGREGGERTLRLLEEREIGDMHAIPLSGTHLPWRIVSHASLHPRDPSSTRDATATPAAAGKGYGRYDNEEESGKRQRSKKESASYRRIVKGKKEEKKREKGTEPPPFSLVPDLYRVISSYRRTCQPINLHEALFTEASALIYDGINIRSTENIVDISGCAITPGVCCDVGGKKVRAWASHPIQKIDYILALNTLSLSLSLSLSVPVKYAANLARGGPSFDLSPIVEGSNYYCRSSNGKRELRQPELFEIARQDSQRRAVLNCRADLEKKNVSTYIVQVVDKSSERRTLCFDVSRKIRLIDSPRAFLSSVRDKRRDDVSTEEGERRSAATNKTKFREANVETRNWKLLSTTRGNMSFPFSWLATFGYNLECIFHSDALRYIFMSRPMSDSFHVAGYAEAAGT